MVYYILNPDSTILLHIVALASVYQFSNKDIWVIMHIVFLFILPMNLKKNKKDYINVGKKIYLLLI